MVMVAIIAAVITLLTLIMRFVLVWRTLSLAASGKCEIEVGGKFLPVKAKFAKAQRLPKRTRGSVSGRRAK